ncbi:MAG: hypothetical protein NVSMB58_17940 [Terriglobales bacterium]
MRRFLLALVAIFVETAVLNFVIHGVLLHLFYQQMPQPFGPKATPAATRFFFWPAFSFLLSVSLPFTPVGLKQSHGPAREFDTDLLFG